MPVPTNVTTGAANINPEGIIPTMEFNADSQAMASYQPPIDAHNKQEQPIINNVLPAQNMILVHVNAGETFTIQAEDSTRCIPGPAQVPMVSPTGMIPPIHVPPGYEAHVLEDRGVRRVVVTQSNMNMTTTPLYHAGGWIHTETYAQPNFMTNTFANFVPNPVYTANPSRITAGFVPTPPKFEPMDTHSSGYYSASYQTSDSPSIKTTVYCSTQTSLQSTESSTTPSSGSSFCTTPSPNDSPESSPRITGLQQSNRKFRNNSKHSSSNSLSPLSSTKDQKSTTSKTSLNKMNNSSPHKTQQDAFYNISNAHMIQSADNNNTGIMFVPTQSGSLPTFTHSLHLENSNFVRAPPIQDSNNGENGENILTISKPQVQVIDIKSRSALIQWGVPSVSDDVRMKMVFAVFSERIKNASSPRMVYRGQENSFELCNLKPAVQYMVRVQATHQTTETFSDTATFHTQSSIPDTPGTPDIVNKNKTSLTLRWMSPQDNGEKILKYELEWDEGNKGSGFRSLFTGSQKQQRFSKLSPSTEYTFRIAACNKIGISPWSPEATYRTSDAPPNTPEPPVCTNKSVNALQLTWKAVSTSTNVHYRLEMDSLNGYGFIPTYNGPDTHTTVPELERNKDYKFRLNAYNDSRSGWSAVVTYSTTPDKPLAPGKPFLVGKPQPRALRVGWDAPKDTGGGNIFEYSLEANKDRTSAMKVIYNGLEREYLFNEAMPGHSYKFRVSCRGQGGDSQMSDVAILTTSAVHPDACLPPLLGSKPKAMSLLLVWDPPGYDGGSKVTLYEVCYKLCDSDTHMKEVYKGGDTKCFVGSLKPGTKYAFIVRAFNKIGHGRWSDEAKLSTAAGAPQTPTVPMATNITATSFRLEWQKPVCNGSEIIHYNVEWGHSHGSMNVSQVDGQQITMDILLPNTIYYYRLQAVNGAGQGSYSEVGTVQTAPSQPGKIMQVHEMDAVDAEALLTSQTDEELLEEDAELYAKTNMLALEWSEACDNGCQITKYVINVQTENDISTYSLDVENLSRTTNEEDDIRLQYVVCNMEADTEYSISIFACNAIGRGECSDLLKTRTHPLPPSPPILTCIMSNHNSFKLKWDDQSKHCSSHLLQIQESNKHTRWTTIYRGSNHKYQVSRLSECTSYNFRINTRNNAGEGIFSEIYTFQTTEAPLPAVGELQFDDKVRRLSWNEITLKRECYVSYLLTIRGLTDRVETIECLSPQHIFSVLDEEKECSATVNVIVRHKNTDIPEDDDASSSTTHGPMSTICTFTIPSVLSSQNKTTNDSVVLSESSDLAKVDNIFHHFSNDVSDETKTVVIISLFAILSIFLTFFLQSFML